MPRSTSALIAVRRSRTSRFWFTWCARRASPATPFATFERKIREQLLRTLGSGGFDPARDIEAITVNRWPHGYAPEYNSLFDPDVPPAQRPHVIGRARFGRVTIANSDAGAAAYTDSAIDQASRAVNELLSA
jgi:spermidine dehydrogenase